jgi:V/A-type H+-transporting ATPase subunit K
MKTMRRFVILGSMMSVVIAVVLALGLNYAFAQFSEQGAPAAKTQMTDADAKFYGALVIGAAIAGGLGFLGAGYAVGHVGAAALGAASERPEMLLRSLIIIALGEGIAILGLVVAFWLILRLPK